MTVNALDKHFKILNDEIREYGDVTIENCLGQRFIASGQSDKMITINGTPGNALGAYLNGAKIVVNGNAQDATGDTMNLGEIDIFGSTGDAAGYAMRGGEIYIRDDAGYRAGIHMKQYEEKLPAIVIGGKCGSFLGEYQAGGIIMVLGLGCNENEIVGNFCATGMHGGKIFVRCNEFKTKITSQINCKKADAEDMAEIDKYIDRYCQLFDCNKDEILEKSFYVLTPNTNNPYRQLYVRNDR